MEPKIVAIGDYFVNLNNLLWAETIHQNASGESKEFITMLFTVVNENPITLTLSSPWAQTMIEYLRANSEML